MEQCILEDLKRHLNVDFDTDDAYIMDLYASALSTVEIYLQAPICSYNERAKSSIRHALRMLVGTWYANREAVAYTSTIEVPFSVNALLIPLKRYKTE